MFESMKFAALLQKGVFEESRNMDSYEVIKMATINGAKALGLSDEIRKRRRRKKSRHNFIRFKHRDNKSKAGTYLLILYIILREAMFLIQL